MNGKIIEVSRLNFDCDLCGKLAVLKVRTQYPHALTERILFFCPTHIPVQALNSWLSTGGKIPE